MAIIRFHIVPNAKQNKVTGEHGAAIKIKLRAPAVEGKANAALRSFLADELKLPEDRIVLERGHKSREKLIRIDGLSEEEVRSHLPAAVYDEVRRPRRIPTRTRSATAGESGRGLQWKRVSHVKATHRSGQRLAASPG